MSKNILEEFENHLLQSAPIKNIDFKSGDTVKITEKYGSKSQTFEGVVISIRNRNNRTSVMLRKTVNKISIEKSFLIFSPNILNVEVIKRGVVRRAKLYYLRNLSGKKAKIRERIFISKK